jgi:lipopolysaccharide export system protein LptA
VELRNKRDVLRADRMRYDIDLKTVHAESGPGQRVTAALEPRHPREGDVTP